jgi:hypothetical protein
MFIPDSDPGVKKAPDPEHCNYLVCEGKERDFSHDVAESDSVLLGMKGD